MTTIHPTALLDKQAKLGADVNIGAFSIVEADVEIGDGTTIASNVLVADGARIGKECLIHNGAVVSTLPQDLKFGGEKTILEIGDNTTIREFCTLNRGTNESGKSSVGSNCLLMAYAHVAHDCHVGDNVIIANTVQLAGHVEIEDHAIIGGMVGIHQFCRVGQHVMIGGGFRITRDVPPYILAMGEPLQFAGINSIGLRRRGFKPDVLSALKKTYRLLYRSKLNVSQAVARIKEDVEMLPQIVNVLHFIETAERGLL